jgi:nitrate/nitrite transport system ATP-binding protein
VSLILRGVDKAYGAASIVEDVSFEVGEGEFVALIGHSGCGKSTVLSMIAGLTGITRGQILAAGVPVRGAGPDRGVVFQAPCLFPWLTAVENVRLGVDQVFAAEPAPARQARAEAAMRAVGLGDAFAQRPAALSAGMRQRVALARAFALSPPTLLLDEPFGMLDSITRADLQDLLLAMADRCPSTLMVTHDIDEALLLADRIVVMSNGPAARVAAVLEVPFGRPRQRAQVLAHPGYAELRARLYACLDTPGLGVVSGAA